VHQKLRHPYRVIRHQTVSNLTNGAGADSRDAIPPVARSLGYWVIVSG